MNGYEVGQTRVLNRAFIFMGILVFHVLDIKYGSRNIPNVKIRTVIYGDEADWVLFPTVRFPN